METLYGLTRCDTCKKARAWLDAHDIEYRFVDYREEPIAARDLLTWAGQMGWPKLINRASTTWRSLTDAQKDVQDDQQWLLLLAAHPTLIRRPLLVRADGTAVAGFKPAEYATLFGTTP